MRRNSNKIQSQTTKQRNNAARCQQSPRDGGGEGVQQCVLGGGGALCKMQLQLMQCRAQTHEAICRPMQVRKPTHTFPYSLTLATLNLYNPCLNYILYTYTNTPPSFPAEAASQICWKKRASALAAAPRQRCISRGQKVNSRATPLTFCSCRNVFDEIKVLRMETLSYAYKFCKI
jgi:hypothetical protein